MKAYLFRVPDKKVDTEYTKVMETEALDINYAEIIFKDNIISDFKSQYPNFISSSTDKDGAIIFKSMQYTEQNDIKRLLRDLKYAYNIYGENIMCATALVKHGYMYCEYLVVYCDSIYKLELANIRDWIRDNSDTVNKSYIQKCNHLCMNITKNERVFNIDITLHNESDYVRYYKLNILVDNDKYCEITADIAYGMEVIQKIDNTFKKNHK